MATDFTHDVFLSHNSRDKPRVRQLADRLRASGLRVWFDEWTIRAGDDIYLAIERGLQTARVQGCACRRRRLARSGWRWSAALCCSATPLMQAGASFRCC
jgi:TIR domain